MTMLRRAVQWGAIGLLMALPLLSRAAAIYQAYGPGARNVGAMGGAWEAFLYSGFAWLFGGFEDPAAIADLFQGSFWSITLFGFTVSDPLAALGHGLATASVHWPLAAGVVGPLVLAALAGRFFCGWICPVNTLLELNARLRGFIERRVARLRLPSFRAPPRWRWVMLAAGIAISAVAGFNAFAFMLPYVGLARDWYLGVYGEAVGFGVLFMVVLAAVELVWAPRLWCRALCPTGLVLELVGRRRVVGIRRKESATCLSGCHLCNDICPTGVAPRDEIDTTRCMTCNLCVERCPADVLEIGKPSRRTGGGRGAARLGAVCAVVLALGPASDAGAHHIKGLPHYGYLDNYPQTPTREIRLSAAPFEATLVVYTMEGFDRSRASNPDDAMVYVSITDGRTGKAYTGPIALTLSAVGGGAVVRRRFKAPLEETVYRTRATLTADAYDVELRIGESARATARLVLGGGINPFLAASAAVAGAAAIVIGAQAVRRRRRRIAAGLELKGERHAGR